MSKPTHVLELNGRQYDAMTGKLLSPAVKSVDGFVPAQPATPRTHTHVGFHASRQEVNAKPEPRPGIASIKVPPRAPQKAMDIARGPVHHAKPHQLQHSKTLVRQAVHHPTNSFKRHTKVAPHTSSLVAGVHFDIVPKHSAQIIDEERLHRARTIAKSGLVRRFAAAAPVPRPTATYQPRTTPAPIQRPITAASRPISEQTYDDVFERALAAATSHQQPPVRQKKHTSKVRRLRQLTSVAASTLIVLLIAGFVAYQNATAIQLRLASSRAGINATLPAWQPAGFKLGTFAYGPGNVTVKYQNQLSGQTLTIAQASSNWDSSTLLSEFVYPNNATYDTLDAHGATIYTYGKNSATWVSGGIWYKLTSDTSLSNTDIVNIATSM